VIKSDNLLRVHTDLKKEPSPLKEYAVTVTTAADSEDCSNKNDSEAENY